MRKVIGSSLLLGLGLGALLVMATGEREPLRIVTYNIEDFPKDDVQVEYAFRTIAGLDAPVVAVQEIMDAQAFERAARSELGPNWKTAVGGGERAVGLLYDSERLRLRSTREHDIGGRKVLEGRFKRKRGRDVRVFVVHLKAGGGKDDVEKRRKQLEKLTRVVAKSRDEIVVLGDFNATSPVDRQHLRLFAARTGLSWASEQLECTAYWNQRDKDEDGNEELVNCPGSALDHVFTREQPRAIAAKGQCEDIGCDGGLLCPLSRFVVSDHCPVLTEL
jgi:endonuclease/exonuclease/phosphatase family metal-dependent hydrolase